MRTPGRARSLWWRHRHALLPLAILLALWIPGANQGWYRTDTHYYAAIARQAWDAALHERAAVPLLDLKAGAEPYFNKPPLAFIIHGGFIEALGLSLWAVRLPSLLAAMGCAWATTLALRRVAGWRLALAGGLVLATTLEFFRYTRAISLDLWLALWLALALLMVAAGLRRRGRPSATLLVLSGVPVALALLTKPLMGLAFPAVIGLWLGLTGRGRLAWTMLAAAALAAALAAPWHLWMAARHPEFALVYFKQQGLDRALGGHGATLAPGAASAPAPEPWWYYLRIIGQSYWPWLATLALGLFTLATGRERPRPHVRRTLGLAALWCGAWLLALSLAGGKSDRYLVLVWPFMAALAAWPLARPAAGLGKRVGRVFMDLAAPAALAASVVLAVVGVRVHAPRDPAWDELTHRLDAAPGATLVTTPRGHPIGAHLVMLGRPWPPMLHGPPAPGAWILSHPDEPAPANAHELMRSEEFVLSAP
jgi:4-amino-4-deoxy-L-arabinose transferase-like glycosyltransferase